MKESRRTHPQQLYKLDLKTRLSTITKLKNLTTYEQETLIGTERLTAQQADLMIENAIGTYNLPLGIATNFLINNRELLIPMAIEEPSVIAAVSYAAKLFRESGGFYTSTDNPIMIGQIQLLDIPDIAAAKQQLTQNKNNLLTQINQIGGKITELGGGAKDIELRTIDTPIGTMLIVHILFNTKDAMGANIINTAAEYIAPTLEDLTQGRANLRILSNLSDRRKARAEGTIKAHLLERDHIPGEDVIKRIIEAATFAEYDPYRAATHNKGIMNGIDAVIIATGNDWRAVEAGAHAYAARGGSYSSLTKWWRDNNGDLKGSIELPLAVGIVGGATRVHPTAQTALKILGVSSAQELAEVCAAVGLAQNFAAIRALATEGIQRGHMRMHAKQLATAAGAQSNEVSTIVQRMIEENNIRLQRAEELVKEIRQGKDR